MTSDQRHNVMNAKHRWIEARQTVKIINGSEAFHETKDNQWTLFTFSYYIIPRLCSNLVCTTYLVTSKRIFLKLKPLTVKF